MLAMRHEPAEGTSHRLTHEPTRTEVKQRWYTVAIAVAVNQFAFYLLGSNFLPVALRCWRVSLV